ncbi:putative oxidoreductase [Venturia nashicola]|uniref:Putative oxidoreductase n=1 Tax=Venturia nashicola TaxID=86259 RepID=A0A4Z1PFA9_9PEZI|nr:putative oxidoreductase [Venturia nashicola]TLD31963.1 putative oxidoreductase [Venturia nashicola]
MIDEIKNSGCSPQSQSPLFKIPGEIREQIFFYVLSESDGTEAISQHDYCYRPDYPSHRYIDTALLRTCRQIWVETYTLPRRNVSPRIWLGSTDRQSPRRFAYAEGVNEDVLFPVVESDTIRRTIYPNESLQVFAQMYSLEWGELNEAVQNASVKISPRRITITLRYTDWWNWEVNSPLRIDDQWAEKFRAPNSVQEIVLELETRNGKRPELDALISRQISKWTFHTKNEEDLVLHGQRREKFHVGSAIPGGVKYEHHSEYANRSGPMGQDEMLYYTVKLRWRKEA